jgi:hypothetical protein
VRRLSGVVIRSRRAFRVVELALVGEHVRVRVRRHREIPLAHRLAERRPRHPAEVQQREVQSDRDASADNAEGSRAGCVSQSPGSRLDLDEDHLDPLLILNQRCGDLY